MSLSFPTSPINGQIYQNWVWSSSVGAWQPNYAAGFVNSFNGRGGVVTLQPSDNTAGNRVLLSSQNVQTTAPVASVTFTGVFGAYDEYLLDCYNIQPSTSSNLMVKFSADNGSTWQDGAQNYQYTWLNSASYSTGANGVGTSGYGFNIGSSAAVASTAINRMRMLCSMLKTTDRIKFVIWDAYYWDASGLMQIRGSGGLAGGAQAAMPVNGIRVLQTTGNFNRGVFNLYGLVNGSVGQ